MHKGVPAVQAKKPSSTYERRRLWASSNSWQEPVRTNFFPDHHQLWASGWSPMLQHLSEESQARSLSWRVWIRSEIALCSVFGVFTFLVNRSRITSLGISAVAGVHTCLRTSQRKYLQNSIDLLTLPSLLSKFSLMTSTILGWRLGLDWARWWKLAEKFACLELEKWSFVGRGEIRYSNTYIASNSACKGIENVIEASLLDVGNELSVIIGVVVADNSKLVARLPKHQFHNRVREEDETYRSTRISSLAASKLIISL